MLKNSKEKAKIREEWRKNERRRTVQRNVRKGEQNKEEMVKYQELYMD